MNIGFRFLQVIEESVADTCLRHGVDGYSVDHIPRESTPQHDHWEHDKDYCH